VVAGTFESRGFGGASASGRSLSRLHNLLPRAIRTNDWQASYEYPCGAD
jgi:hypothetical protein